jgi:hypothetical protein
MAALMSATNYSLHFFSDVQTKGHVDSKHTLQKQNFVKIQILTAASMKMRVLWDIALCSLVEADRRLI